MFDAMAKDYEVHFASFHLPTRLRATTGIACVCQVSWHLGRLRQSATELAQVAVQHRRQAVGLLFTGWSGMTG